MSDHPQTAKHPGPLALLALYLAARRPAALAADAIVLLTGALLFHHVWTAFYATLDPVAMARPSGSLASALAQPTALFATIYSVLYHTAIALLGWAAVRAICDAIRSAGARVHPDS